MFPEACSEPENTKPNLLTSKTEVSRMFHQSGRPDAQSDCSRMFHWPLTPVELWTTSLRYTNFLKSPKNGWCPGPNVRFLISNESYSPGLTNGWLRFFYFRNFITDFSPLKLELSQFLFKLLLLALWLIFVIFLQILKALGILRYIKVEHVKITQWA